MSRADELRAELVVAELEERLAAAKADKKGDPDEYRALKLELREARQAQRENRED
jgi:hypothetical protein